jgi:hypothetical protein
VPSSTCADVVSAKPLANVSYVGSVVLGSQYAYARIDWRRLIAS